MIKFAFTTATLMLASTAIASAAMPTPTTRGLAAKAPMVHNVDRRRVCEWRHGHRHCWWVGHRDWDDGRWERWHRENWRNGWFYLNTPGVSVRVR